MHCPIGEAPTREIRLRGGPAAHAFFFDVDGTLVDIADEPGLACAGSDLVEALERLFIAARGGVAMISGRSVADVDRLLAPLRLPVAGQHGAERRDAAGAVHTHSHCTAQMEALRRCVGERLAGVPGLLVEDKGMSLAVHYRRAPERGDAVLRMLRECLERTGEEYRLQHGKMVVELKPAGRDKGIAIGEFMAEAPFAGRVPVFIGDDATDEHGFATVNGLDGHSIKVGQGPTVARWRMPDAEAVRAWLRGLIREEA